MYQLWLYAQHLPGQYLHIPYPKISLPTYIIIGKLLDDYGDALKNHPDQQIHFETKFTKDEKDDIMS